MLKICIIGYGQMGKLLDKISCENNCKVINIIDPLLNNDISQKTISQCDICIDFTKPDVVVENIKKIAACQKNIVIGTTGWYEHLEKVRKITEQNEIGIIYGSNFSLGMNLFFKLIKESVNIMKKCPQYDIFGYEMHHRRKVDSPSGTAKKISQIILDNCDNKHYVQFEKLDRKINEDEFHFGSIRGGYIPGIHTVGFDSAADTIELKHTARNREGLALGAIKAAHWLKGKTGFYEFSDVFSEILEI